MESHSTEILLRWIVLIPLLGAAVNGILNRRLPRQVAGLLACATVGVSFALLPPADFLPDGNRNLVIWRAEPLPGTSLPEAVRQAEPLKEFIRTQPEIERTWLVDRPGGMRRVLSVLKPEFATAAGLDAMVERLHLVQAEQLLATAAAIQGEDQ